MSWRTTSCGKTSSLPLLKTKLLLPLRLLLMVTMLLLRHQLAMVRLLLQLQTTMTTWSVSTLGRLLDSGWCT